MLPLVGDGTEVVVLDTVPLAVEVATPTDEDDDLEVTCADDDAPEVDCAAQDGKLPPVQGAMTTVLVVGVVSCVPDAVSSRYVGLLYHQFIWWSAVLPRFCPAIIGSTLNWKVIPLPSKTMEELKKQEVVVTTNSSGWRDADDGSDLSCAS